MHVGKQNKATDIEMGKKHPIRYKLTLLFTGLLLFSLGINIGNGHIHFRAKSRNYQNSSLPAQLDYTSVNSVYKALKDNYDGKLTETQLLDGLKAGLAQSTKDPYTEYFTAAQANDFRNQINGTFSGIGAQLGKDSDGNLEVIAPIAGTPAEKAGLKPKDIITAIDNESTTNMTVDTAVSKIRGKKGSTVNLKIVRDKQQSLALAIVRRDIIVPSVTSRMLEGSGAIGYIQISQFSEDTGGLTRQAATKLKTSGAKAIVLDLRSNPGGLLSAAVDVSSLWLPSGKTVLDEKQGNTVVQHYTATGNPVLQDVPTVVLIDGGSASAAEITAGALHDNSVAKLIGTKSYGKGVVQQIINLNDGSELKVTVASWYRPNGQNINHKGITPDTNVVVTNTDVAANKDLQLETAITQLSSP